MRTAINRFRENTFLFSELIKRDFKKKYKRTYLGMLWSVLSPLLSLLVLSLVFTNFFGRSTPHYTIYIFCGQLMFSFFSDATGGSMGSIMANSSVFSKINVPKYLFLFSREVTALINFGLTFLVFLIFCIIDGITFTWAFLLLIFPIVCLVIFNLGIGLLLSALFIFFRDMQYLWSVFSMLVMYMSAIFYTVDSFGNMSKLFYLNPLYVYITYFRTIVIYNQIPSLWLHLLALGYAALAFLVGGLIYKFKNHKFIYYV